MMVTLYTLPMDFAGYLWAHATTTNVIRLLIAFFLWRIWMQGRGMAARASRLDELRSQALTGALAELRASSGQIAALETKLDENTELTKVGQAQVAKFADAANHANEKIATQNEVIGAIAQSIAKKDQA